MEPKACLPEQLPKFQPSHEMELKRIRHEKDEAKKRGQNQQPPQQPDAKRMRHNHPGMQHNPHAGKDLIIVCVIAITGCDTQLHLVKLQAGLTSAVLQSRESTYNVSAFSIILLVL